MASYPSDKVAAALIVLVLVVVLVLVLESVDRLLRDLTAYVMTQAAPR
jgi:hypothetical protein